MRWITLISTGGTLEKTYNERTGSLENKKSVLHRLLRRAEALATTKGVRLTPAGFENSTARVMSSGRWTGVWMRVLPQSLSRPGSWGILTVFRR